MSNMNLPNKLTLMRLCLVPVNVAVLLLPVSVLKWQAVIEGLLPFTLAIIIVALIDLYEYRCEREDKISLDELEDRIEKLEGNLDER